jgi:hypothetical protein
MAGEWIPLDCNLGTKPEVLELVDETGLPVEAVCWRLIQLWSWAALNSSDGTIRATPARLGAVAGGDEAFWLAVERVGWVTFSNGTLVINGWDKRFSRAAKARLEDARRKAEKRVENRNVRTLSEKCPEKNGLQERTVQERTEEAIQPAAPVATSDPPKRRKRSQPPDAVSWTADAGWAGITDADRQEWRLAYPACDLAAELAKATSWLRANPAKAHKSNWRRFLVSWLTRSQDRGGTHREPGRRPDEKPPPKAWRDEYRPAPYRSPKEVAALAAGMKLKEEDL